MLYDLFSLSLTDKPKRLARVDQCVKAFRKRHEHSSLFVRSISEDK
jgi:hypothetical protein